MTTGPWPTGSGTRGRPSDARPSPALVALAAMAEGLSDGFAVTDPAGDLVLENGALRRLLDANPEGPALRPLLDEVARSLASAAPRCRAPVGELGAPLVAAHERLTARGTYRVRGAWLADDALSGEPAVLPTLTIESTRARTVDAGSQRRVQG